jgi:hypothetical protein
VIRKSSNAEGSQKLEMDLLCVLGKAVTRGWLKKKMLMAWILCETFFWQTKAGLGIDDGIHVTGSFLKEADVRGGTNN